uniref:Uncharacterized protein n=1 Tax=Anopheles minimus TaxID=112268 RepID=A0A182WPR4_9DIPT
MRSDIVPPWRTEFHHQFTPQPVRYRAISYAA